MFESAFFVGTQTGGGQKPAAVGQQEEKNTLFHHVHRYVPQPPQFRMIKDASSA